MGVRLPAGGLLLPARLDYTEGFYRTRLPCLLAVSALYALVHVAVALERRWRLLTRRIDIGLHVAIVSVLSWFRVKASRLQRLRL